MRIFLLSIAFLLFHLTAQAQEVVASAGDYLEQEDLSISWTLGELVTETMTHNQITLSQGQQQFHVRVILGVDTRPFDLVLSAYPNPTSTNLQVQVSEETGKRLMLTLHNSLGRMLLQQELSPDQEQTITMSHYPAGVYIITVQDQQGILKSLKIVKQ